MKTATVRNALFLAAGLGLLVAIFASVEFYEASLRSVCSINGFLSCGRVDQSGKTTTFGIQDYLWGLGGFVLLLIVAGVAESRKRDVRPAYLLVLLATAAVGLSAYFLYVQIVEIGALCVVCASAEVLGTIVWVLSIELARRTALKARADRGAPAVGTKAAGPPT